MSIICPIKWLASGARRWYTTRTDRKGVISLPRYILCAVLGYLLGSFSASILISKYIFRHDVRKSGSGNAGAANTARVFGMGAGLLTLLGDFVKCLLAMLITRAIAGELGMCVGGASCMLGHCFPIFYGFRGGKGILVSAGVILMLNWRVLLIILAVFLLVVVFTKTVSLGSISAAAAYPVSTLIVDLIRKAPHPFLNALSALIIGGIVIFMHRSNIKRLLNGTENKLGQKKKS